MRRDEWVTVHGPVKEQQPDGMSHVVWGGHLAQKAWEILGTEGAEENFSLGYTRTGVGGDRHLVTVPRGLGGGASSLGKDTEE